MKTWNNPVATVQEFVANEYVSACTFTLTCDVPLEEGFKQYTIFMDKPYPICGGEGKTGGTLTQTTYKPCAAPHTDMSTNGEFFPVTFTEGAPIDGSPVRKLSEPIECWGWAVFCEHDHDGVPHIVDGHCTLSNVMENANKS